MNQLEGIVGTQYDDVLIGNSSDNQIVGNGGHDVLSGLTGTDGYGLPKEDDGSGDRAHEYVYERIDLGVPWQIDTEVPDGTNYTQAVAVDGQGNSIHMWLTAEGIVGRRFDAAGAAIGTVFTVVESDDVSRPRVSTDAAGNFVVAWEEAVSAEPHVFLRRYAPLGNDVVAGDVVQVSDISQTTDNENPSVLLHDDGGVTVAWEAIDSLVGTNVDIDWQRFDADDQPLWEAPEIVYETTASGDQRLGTSGRAIAADSDGGFAVAWIDDRQIFVRRFDSEGVTPGSETVLATSETASGTVLGDVSVAFDAAGDVLVTWWQQTPSSPSGMISKIMLRRYDAEEASWQPSVALVDFASSFWVVLNTGYGPPLSLTDLQIATDRFGHLGIAWTHNDYSIEAYWSFAQWFTAAGQPVTAPTRLNATTTYEAARNSSIAANANGRFVATWGTPQSFVASPVDFAWTPTSSVAPPRLDDVPLLVLEMGLILTNVTLTAVYPSGSLDDVRIEGESTNPDGVLITMSQTEPGVATLEWDPPQDAAPGLYLINVDVRDQNNPSARTRAVVRVAYGEENIPPVLTTVPDQTVVIGQTLSFQLTASDADGPDFDLRYSHSGSFPSGATLNPVTGAFSWTPTAQDVAQHTFNLVVSDQGLPSQSDPQSITITVLAANVAPTFSGPTSATFDEDNAFVFASGNVIAVADADNDSSDELELAIVATHGEFLLPGTSGLELLSPNSYSANDLVRKLMFRGTETDLNSALDGLTFQPDDDFYGTAELRLELNDLGNGGSHPAAYATRVIALAVDPVEDDPSIAAQTFDLSNWGQNALVGTIAVQNPDPDRLLTYSILSDTSGGLFFLHETSGAVTLANPSGLTAGMNYVLVVEVAYDSGSAGATSADVTIHVPPSSNNWPAPYPDTYGLDEGDPVSGNVTTFGTADSDPDSDMISVVAAEDSEGRSLQLGVENVNVLPSGATLIIDETGDFTYDSAPSSSLDAGFAETTNDWVTYWIADIHGARSQTTLTLAVEHINDLHVVDDQEFVVSPNAGYGVVGRVVVNDRESENFTYSIVSGSNGVFDFDSTTHLLMLVDPQQLTGPYYTLVVEITDSLSRAEQATVTIHVDDNVPAAAAGKRYQTPEDVPLWGNVLEADLGGGAAYDPDSPQPLEIASVNGQPLDVGETIQLGQGGILTLDADGSFAYDPASSQLIDSLGLGQTQIVSVPYTIRDALGGLTEAVLYIDVLGRNDAPLARDNAYQFTDYQKLLVGNLIFDQGPMGKDVDPDATDQLRLVGLNGTAVSGELEVPTYAGATLLVREDGSFTYDPSTVPNFASLTAGDRVYDEFAYSISDGTISGAVTAVARITVVVNDLTLEPSVAVSGFGLVNDTGTFSGDNRSEDPRLGGTIETRNLEADHFVVEFDYDDNETFDRDWEVLPTANGFPDFEVDPSSDTLFQTPGQKVIGYRILAYDASDVQLAASNWLTFTFYLLEPPNEGELRLDHGISLYLTTAAITNPEQAGQGVGYVPTSSDPRLFGVVNGDFTDKTAHVEFDYTRGGVSYCGQTDELTTAGEFVYDPRLVDDDLKSFTGTIAVTYRLIVTDTTTTPGTVSQVGQDAEFAFYHVEVHNPTASIASITDVPSQPGDSGDSRTVSVEINLAELDQVAVEFDYAQSGVYDEVPDGEVIAVASGDGENDAVVTVDYTARGLQGAAPKIKARTREWSADDGAYVYGEWTAEVPLSPLQAPKIDSLAAVAPAGGVRGVPKLIGILEGGVPDGPVDPETLGDLAGVANVTIEFYHGNDPEPGTYAPDGLATTDPQGHFEYTPRGLTELTTIVYARTRVTVPGASTIVYGDVKPATVVIAAPDLPTLEVGALALVDPDAATPANGRLVTADPRTTGTLTPADEDGIDFQSVLIEFVHDYGDLGDETPVASVQPDSNGKFIYAPVVMSTAAIGAIMPGDVRLRARVAYFDDLVQDMVHGDWQNLLLTVVLPTNGSTTIEDLDLLTVDSVVEGVKHTFDPTITGRVEDPEGYSAFVSVSFYDPGDLVNPIGTSITDAGGNFKHTLEGLAAGTVTVKARAQEWDFISEQLVQGIWSSEFAFVLEGVQPLDVATFGLQSNTGSDPDDEFTANPLLVGQIEGTGPLGNVTVAIDIGDDDSVEAMVLTDSEGRFSYVPTALDFTEYTIGAKVATWDAATEAFVYSQGVPVTFTLEAPTNADAQVVELVLANPPSGNDPVSDPTIEGEILSERAVAGVTIEFDFDTNDGNGIDGTTTTDAMGRFEFLPVLDADGSYTIRARTREYNAASSGWLWGDWSSLPPFDYESPDKAPDIDSLDYALSYFTEIPLLTGDVSDDATQDELDDLIVEFSFSDTEWVTFGSTDVETDRSFEFVLQGLDAGQPYTVWARVKKPLTEGSSQFVYGDALSENFTYSPTAPSGFLISELSLYEDTDSGAGTDDDGATSNSRIFGSASGVAELEGLIIQFDLDDDGFSDQDAETVAGGAFDHDLELTAPGYYHVLVRAYDPVGNVYSGWRAVNFVFDTDDDSPQALALVQAFAAINPDWQTALEGFDHDFATSSAEALYQLTLDNADANYDFQVAQAQLAREAARRSADSSYRQLQIDAEANYRAAIADAQADFITALAALPAADQANYSLKDFDWPDAPVDNHLVIPGDSQQPKPPATPTYTGPTFDYQQSPSYQLAVRQAEATYRDNVEDARTLYNQDVQDAHVGYFDDVEVAYDHYQDAIEDAQSDYEDARAQNQSPQFDYQEFENYVETIRNAWQRYSDTVREAWLRRNPPQGFNDAADSERAQRDYLIAVADALQETLHIVYPAQEAMAKMARDFRHEEYEDRLNDDFGFTEDLAAARKALEDELAGALNARDELIADHARTRDYSVADAQRTRDMSIAQAKLTATQTWATAVNTLWATYQVALATNEYNYLAASAYTFQGDPYSDGLAGLAAHRDKAVADAVHAESYAVADAVQARAEARALAEQTRTVDLATELLDFQVDTSAVYTDRDNAISGFWFDYLELMVDAGHDYSVAWAEIFAERSIALLESNLDYEESLPIWLKAALAFADIDEELALTRIDAIEDYRTSTNQEYCDAAVAIADLQYTYQTDVAVIQDNYNLDIATAARDYSVDLAKATSVRNYHEALANGEFDVVEASLTRVRNVGDATEKAGYELDEVDAHLDALDTWAGVTPTRWGAYQIALAEVERARVIAQGEADIARAEDLGDLDITWTEAIVAADLDYAVAVYGDDQGTDGALVQRTKTIAGAQVSIASNNSTFEYVDAIAAATKTHDQGVAEETCVFYNALAAANATRDAEVTKAHFKWVRESARAYYSHEAGDISDQEYADRLDGLWLELAIRGARADEVRAVAVAEARRDWTAAVGALNVALVEAQVAAQIDRAEQVREDMRTLADAVAGAQATYEIAVALAVEEQSIAFAAADGDYGNSAAAVEAVYAVEVDTALSGKSVGDAAALGNYETGLHSDHVSVTASYDAVANTPLSEFQKLVAAADSTWASERAAARNAYHYHASNVDLSDIEAARTGAINTANIAHAARASAATQAHTIDQSAADRVLATALAIADSGLYLAKKYAEADLIVDATNEQGQADVAYAKAVAARDNAYAEASVVWVKTVAASYVAFVSEEITYEQHVKNREAADEARQKAREAADEAFQKAVDEAGVEEEQDLGAARIAYVDAVYSSKVVFVQTTNAAYETYAIVSAQNDLQFSTRIAQSTEMQENQLLVADYQHTLALVDLDVAYQNLLLAPGVDRAEARADAEVDYHVSTANAETVGWFELAAANPSDDQLRFRMAESAAYAAWLDELTGEYVTFQSELATADGQGNAALSLAIADQQATQAEAALRYGVSIAALQRIRTLSLLVPQNQSGIAAVRNENASKLAIAETTYTHALAHVNAKVGYDEALDAIERRYRDDPYGQAAGDAQDLAVYHRDVAFADADVNWRGGAAQAEFDFAIAEAAREYDLLLREAALERAYTIETARAAAVQDTAFARAERTKMLADEAARNGERADRALATADFQSAVYASKYTALDELMAGLPRADGEIHGIDAGYASGDLNFTANLADGSFDEGEFTVDGTGFTKHASAGGGSVSLEEINWGILVDDDATGTGYILYSAAEVHSRFSANPPHDDNSDHLIAVRYNSGTSQWQYNDDTAWRNFSPTTGDVLIAEVDFDNDMIDDLGGVILWAQFQKDRAGAEQAAWEAVKTDYLDWQADVSAANDGFAQTRADAYLDAALTTVDLEWTYQRTSALMTQAHVVELAGLQRDFELELADLVSGYRADLAEAQYDYERQDALEVLNGTSTGEALDAFEAAIESAEEGYAEGYVELDHARRQAMAQAAHQLVSQTAELYQQQADLIADAQDDFTATVNDAYYTTSAGTDGLEETLADLAHGFNTLQSQTLKDELAALATANSTPFSDLAAAEADARHSEVTQPLADLERDQRSDLAAAENQYRSSLTSADRTRWLTEVGADSTRAKLGAASTLGFAANVWPSFDENDLPEDLAPPLVDLGEITLLQSLYLVTQPGSVGDGWFDYYLGWGIDGYGWGWYGAGGYGYWYGESWGYGYGSFWAGFGPYWAGDFYSYGWAYDPYGWGFGGWGLWYGGWGYNPGYFGFGGWYPGYVAPPSGLSGGYQIDVDALLLDYHDTLEKATAPIDAAHTIVISTKDLTPLIVDPATGAGQLGDVPEPEPLPPPGLPPPPPPPGGETTTNGIRLDPNLFGEKLETSRLSMDQFLKLLAQIRRQNRHDSAPFLSDEWVLTMFSPEAEAEILEERAKVAALRESMRNAQPQSILLDGSVTTNAKNVSDLAAEGMATFLPKQHWKNVSAGSDTRFGGTRVEPAATDNFGYAVVSDVIGDKIVTLVLERSKASDNSYHVMFQHTQLIDIGNPSPQQVAEILGKKRERAHLYVDLYLGMRKVKSLEANAAAQTFILHLIPGGAAADEFSQGNYLEASISLAGDAAMFIGGPLTKFAAAKGFAKTARGLHTAAVYTEAGIGGVRLGQAGYYTFIDPDTGKAAGYLGEAFLRLFSAKLQSIAPGAKPPPAVTPTVPVGRGIWEITDQLKRGEIGELLLGKNTPKQFPYVDDWEKLTGTAVSIKTIDIKDKSLKAVKDSLRKSVREIAEFAPVDNHKGRLVREGFTIEIKDIKRRGLRVGIEPGIVTPEQRALFEEIKDYASGKTGELGTPIDFVEFVELK